MTTAWTGAPRCPFCGTRVAERVYVCPYCGGSATLRREVLRIGRLALLVLAGAVVGAVAVFTGVMFWVGIRETYWLVIAAWDVALLVVLALGWLAGRLADEGQDSRSTEQYRKGFQHEG